MAVPLRRFAPGFRGAAQRFVRRLAAALFLPWFRVRAENVPDFDALGPAILAPNHVSFLDPPVLQVACPVHLTFLMTELFYRPRLGRWFFQMWEAIPVPEGRSASASVKGAIAALREGRCVAIFPEGRISTDGCLNEGRGGIALLLARAAVPVVPVAILGTFDVLPRDRRWPRRARVVVRFGEPIRPAAGEVEDARAFSAKVMSAIAALGAPVRPAESMPPAPPAP